MDGATVYGPCMSLLCRFPLFLRLFSQGVGERVSLRWVASHEGLERGSCGNKKKAQKQPNTQNI